MGTLNRRGLLRMIGLSAGSAAMYQAMTRLGLAAQSPYRGDFRLEGNPRQASVVILGAGLAGLVAALELCRAGYRVQVLEYASRPGGRTWTIRGGDRYTELGGFTQNCEFAPGLHFDPGPWRIPYHHWALLDYCKQLGVALEPFVQLNPNSYLHLTEAFGGRPQRLRHIQADFQGYSAELLAKATSERELSRELSREDAEILLEALRDWGALDRSYQYRRGAASSERRGWAREAGGGLTAPADPSEPIGLHDLLSSRLWTALSFTLLYDYPPVMLQPVGGMDMIARAFAREVGGLIRYNSRVAAVAQDAKGVTVTYEDTGSHKAVFQTRADYCLCTIPLSVLSQVELTVSPAMRRAIDSVSYAAAVKIGLQFKRRFWEEDEGIYGGSTQTDLPIAQIAYPSSELGRRGPGVLLGAYAYGNSAYALTSRTPSERIAEAVRLGAQIHPQYPTEFENGVAVAWHRVPATLGCFAMWTDEARAEHYQNLCAIDGRIVLAGEHASQLPAWQEGAILSSLNAMTRLHQRVVAS